MDMIINFFVWPDVTFPVTFLILASALFQDTLYAVLIAIAGVTLMRRRFEPVGAGFRSETGGTRMFGPPGLHAGARGLSPARTGPALGDRQGQWRQG